MSKCYIIRGHHLLCIQGFEGMGYSPAFIQRMKELTTAIRESTKECDIQVVKDFDEACWACPHNDGDLCSSSVAADAKVKGLDERVLEHLHLKAGEVYKKEELLDRIAHSVAPDDLEHLCQGCSWLSYGVCKAGISRLQKRRLS
ncbi:DUF1284 domain-containing protein [Salsuginibacillus kocurii]|uniref:DUF1284 domain-containing protein n=1 Tax=Salsuginibacillus kocurii TaxID=427078 RepID=UPI00036A2B1D|nr:DUF1284 domain-containing protein [Salsuginibacillus kocurii]